MNGVYKIDWTLIAGKESGKNFVDGSCEIDLSTDDVKNEVDGIDMMLAREFLKQMIAQCYFKEIFKRFLTLFIFKSSQSGCCFVSELAITPSMSLEVFERNLLESIEDDILNFRKRVKYTGV